MARPRKPQKGKTQSGRRASSALSASERIQLLTNLVIDRIIQDKNNGTPLLNKVKRGYR